VLDGNMISRSVLLALVLLVLLLPMAIVVVYAVSRLLGVMQDAAGEGLLLRTSEIGVVMWLISLVVLVVALAVHSLGRTDGPAD
jgi:hypothetical protein